jgi:hypothetical protein
VNSDAAVSTFPASHVKLHILTLLLALIGVALSVPCSRAAPASAAPAQHSARQKQDWEALFAPEVVDAMQRWHVPGAAVAIVQGDAVVFSRGFGLADLERQVPVSPDVTVFRVFSLSKLFTATAIMQLLEQQQIDLDSDVNTFLRKRPRLFVGFLVLHEGSDKPRQVIPKEPPAAPVRPCRRRKCHARCATQSAAASVRSPEPPPHTPANDPISPLCSRSECSSGSSRAHPPSVE